MKKFSELRDAYRLIRTENCKANNYYFFFNGGCHKKIKPFSEPRNHHSQGEDHKCKSQKRTLSTAHNIVSEVWGGYCLMKIHWSTIE